MATVKLSVPRGPLFVGSWVRVRVQMEPRTKFKWDDLRFEIPDGPKAGLISVSRERGANPERPEVMLLAGWEPGKWLIQVIHSPTSTVVGEAKFSTTTSWRNEDAGPTKWFSGITESFNQGGAWGGGPAGPQNSNTIPASGTRRIAILLVDTSTERYPTDAATLQGIRDRWMNEIINGAVGDDGGTRSSRAFYREASFNKFDLSAQVFGPVSLPDAFTDYFNDDGSPKGNYYQACFTAGDGLIDYNNFDTLLCVSRSVTGPPMRSAWPYASIGNWGPYTTADGNQTKGVISMPAEWGATGTRRVQETFSHELGHNLGMGDQYTPSVPGRNPGAWEMMHDDNPMPHFSAAHRLALGWVEPAWVQTFNFAGTAATVDQTVSLNPIELGAPPSGRRSVVEVRVADGWNYYFEYRRGQAAQIGDRALPTDDRVLGTDVISAPFVAPLARPSILLLNNDIDGDGAVLGNGQDYEEVDTSDPVYPAEFRADVNGINGSKADLRIRYGVNGRPDPSIRPWPASPDRQWQSPDIEVRNAKNAADPAWFNVPWEGNTNTIVARVKNNGGINAPQVRVNFYVKNYNIGGAPEVFLGFDQKDINANQTVEFTTTWVPPSQGHFCVVVRIPLYQHPTNPAVVEMTELNNLAQSNYNRFISRTASPPSREVTFVEVGNPYPKRTRIWLMGGHTNPLYRTYLENSWLYLDPGEVKRVRVMFEYAPDNLTNKLYPQAMLPKYREMQRVPNRVAVAAFAEDPRDVPRHRIDVIGGAQAEIVTGRDTKFQRFVAEGRAVRGLIVTRDDGKPVKGGQVLLRVTQGDGKEYRYQKAGLDNGQFAVELKAQGEKVKGFYLPPAGLGDSESDEKKI